MSIVVGFLNELSPELLIGPIITSVVIIGSSAVSNNRIDNLQKDLGILQRDSAIQFERMELKFERLDNKLTNIDTKMISLEKNMDIRITNLEKSFDSRVTRLESDVSSIKTKSDRSDEKLTDISNKINTGSLLIAAVVTVFSVVNGAVRLSESFGISIVPPK